MKTTAAIEQFTPIPNEILEQYEVKENKVDEIVAETMKELT
jgi:hypothetical protein